MACHKGLAERNQRHEVVGLDQPDERRAQDDSGAELPEGRRMAKSLDRSTTCERGDENQQQVHHIKAPRDLPFPIYETCCVNRIAYDMLVLNASHIPSQEIGDTQ